MLTVLAKTDTINGITNGYKTDKLKPPRNGIVGDSILMNPKRLARKIMLPANKVNIILIRDLNFSRSSIKPMIPADMTVNIKTKISLIMMGKKIIKKIEAIDNPITMLRPPDSATAGRAFLWIS
jgi:hypothetical protein